MSLVDKLIKWFKDQYSGSSIETAEAYEHITSLGKDY